MVLFVASVQSIQSNIVMTLLEMKHWSTLHFIIEVMVKRSLLSQEVVNMIGKELENHSLAIKSNNLVFSHYLDTQFGFVKYL